MAGSRNRVQAIGYMRTSSATNVGTDKDSEKRQRAAISAFAKSAGYEIVDWYYDAAISGADPVTARPGFGAMLERIAGNGVRTILVESPDRFARDLAVQLAGHNYLKQHEIVLIPTSAPDFFKESTPTAILMRQVLGAVAEFDKATTVAKLRGARDRKGGNGQVRGTQELRRARPRVGRFSEGIERAAPPAVAARDRCRAGAHRKDHPSRPPLLGVRCRINASMIALPASCDRFCRISTCLYASYFPSGLPAMAGHASGNGRSASQATGTASRAWSALGIVAVGACVSAWG
jgi:DNA invertase Pin-like site-specific DNA recombinase